MDEYNKTETKRPIQKMNYMELIPRKTKQNAEREHTN